MTQYLSVCSGIEAASVAFHPLGWKPLAFSEIEAFPSSVLAYHYPTVPNLGDMTKWQSWDWEILGDTDVLVGGPPCFTAGQLVLTEHGYKPIESLQVGDQVLTHEGRLKPILRVGNKDSEVGKLTMVGRPDGIICTPEHPFLSVDWRNQSTKREGNYVRIETCSIPNWTPAKNMVGKQWCATVNVQVPLVKIPSRLFNEAQAMYLAGMYLGDGWTRSWTGKNKKAIILGLNEAKYQKMLTLLGDCDHNKSTHRTGVKISFGDTLFASWLEENFGRLSHLKVLPAWVLSHPLRGLLLEGYLDTDGNLRGSTRTINSTSEALAYGVADLFNIEGYVSSVSKVETSDTCIIEGRVVNQRDYFQVRANLLSVSKKSRVRSGYLLRTVQKWEPIGTERVYNIEVADDNSFVLNGAIVHNCQAFSVAGLRAGLDDERGQLTISYIHLLDHIDEIRSLYGKEPAICLYENVPGILSSKDNAFGAFLGGLAGEDCELVPSGGKWTDAGCVYGPKRSVAWRVLDAQYFGVAQRRKRVFVIASARDIDPSEILFEFDGVRRDTPPSREAGQSSAEAVGGSSEKSYSIIGDVTPKIGEDVCLTMRSQGGGGIVPPSVATWWDGGQCAGTLTKEGAGGNQRMPDKGNFGAGLTPVGYAMQVIGEYADPNIASTCKSRDYKDATDLVTCPVKELSREEYSYTDAEGVEHVTTTTEHLVYPIHDKATRHGGERGVSNGLGIGQPTLDTGGNHAVAIQGSMIGREEQNGPQGDGLNEEVSFTLNCVDRHAVAFSSKQQSMNCSDELANSLGANDFKEPQAVAHVFKERGGCEGGGKGYLGKDELTFTASCHQDQNVMTSMQVRRLTPTECERLQGFPDGHTDVPYRNKPAVDGPRYKSLGNSMAVPVMHWIGRRIHEHLIRLG